MAFQEDVVNWITSEVTFIGLSSDGATEITGGGYVPLAPIYAAAAAGAADITNGPLEFNGTALLNITHLIFKRGIAPGTIWVVRAVAVAKTFNSDGRLNVDSALVTSAFPA